MTRTRRTVDTLTPAVKAIGELFEDGFAKLASAGTTESLMAHSEIKRTPTSQKTNAFFRHFLPLRKEMIALLAASYRRYFKLALAHASQAGGDPDKWTWHQVQPAVRAALEWIRDWYILACDAANQRVRLVGSLPFLPGKTVTLSIPTAVPSRQPPTSWLAPAWLFQISPLVGVGPLKEKHVPDTNSEEKLGVAHTRLLLKGALRVFLLELGAAMETVRNEEIAAAGAIPAEMAVALGGQANKPKHWSKGVEGLVRKVDLSRYTQNLTEKQELAFSLKCEYGLGLAEIAARMGLDRKTAYEHIKAAELKIGQVDSSEKRKARRAKNTPE